MQRAVAWSTNDEWAVSLFPQRGLDFAILLPLSLSLHARYPIACVRRVTWLSDVTVSILSSHCVRRSKLNVEKSITKSITVYTAAHCMHRRYTHSIQKCHKPIVSGPSPWNSLSVILCDSGIPLVQFKSQFHQQRSNLQSTELSNWELNRICVSPTER